MYRIIKEISKSNNLDILKTHVNLLFMKLD